MQLSGKTALVTGSSSGIGRAVALAFSHEGADVAVHYHQDQAGADEVAGQLKALGRRAPVFSADAAVPTEMQTLVDQAVQALGRLDILVCSAGLEIREPFLDVSESTTSWSSTSTSRAPTSRPRRRRGRWSSRARAVG
jgi:NAD(P)-dependent dehydrogenase (short-subunit alcohol dehydrogenase family)